MKAMKLLSLLLVVVFLTSMMPLATPVYGATSTTFTAEELLGKPTDSSITINIVPDSTIIYHYQYGTSEGNYLWQTPDVEATGGQPGEVVISGLSPNTQYYYRMRYRAPEDSPDDWVNRAEQSFRTQRSPGSEFSFTVTSDMHEYFNTSTQNAMTNILNDHPDFHIDLGDIFLLDNVSSQTAVNNEYLAYRNPLYLDKIGGSVPVFLSSGNHENEEGWNLDDSPFSVGLASIQARKAFFPTPIDDGIFYSGNTDPLPAINETIYGDEFREDYYAWEWGDALFVVIDPFQYTMNNPYGSIAGEGSDDPVSGDQWNWTLGEQQYQWLKDTLEGSDAKYKFVFSHNMLGGIPRDISVNPAGYVRGGAEAAAYFEWGGLNADGSDGFASKRPGWEAPIHQLLLENGVSAYFHGHDHQYVYETRDGIVYQEVPSPGMGGSGFSGIYSEGDHGDYQTIEILPNSGYLRITVTPEVATVDYITSSNTTGVSNYSYSIEPNDGPTDPVISVTGVPLDAFTSAPGTPSDPQSFTISGSNLTADITATSTNADFQISLSSDSGFGPSLVLSQSGGSVSTTPIYVRFNRDIVGASSGNISLTSAGATTKNVAVSGTATSTALIPVTLDGAVSSATGDANASSVSFSHTTGSGTNRLMLVGVSWNCG
ncbi:MAG: metallophosphoesterase, partial [Dehalococcoidales bacterium]|nr:metallophosphoesterase [Dehalococcoidales bacterium]